MAVESDMLEQLREVFSQLANEDGLIKVEEFIDMACDQVGVSREQAGELSAHLDPNSKGAISLEDICQSVMSMQQSRTDLQMENSVDDKPIENSQEGFEDVDSATRVGSSLSVTQHHGDQVYSSISSDQLSFGETGEEFEGSGEVKEQSLTGMTSPGSHSSYRVTPNRQFRRPSSGRPSPYPGSSGFTSHEVSSDEEQEVRARDNQLTELSQQLSSLHEKLITVQEERDNSTSQQKRIKQEYTHVKERLHLLEEQLLESESKRQAALQRLEARQKMKMAQMENRKSAQLESLRLQLSQAEETISQMQTTDTSVRQQLKDAREALTAKKEQSEDLRQALNKKTSELRSLQEQQRREKEGAAATIEHLEQQLEEVNSRSEALQQQNEELRVVQQANAQDARILNTEEYLRQDAERLQKEVNRLRDRNEELSGQLVQQGKMLMDSRDNESLAAELEVKSKDEIMEALKEEKSYSARLHQYISNLLAVVVEKSPQLLEIRPQRQKH